MHFEIALWKFYIYNIVMQYDNERKYIIETAIGLQDVDNLKNSEYFLKLSNQYLNGEISIKELDRYICSYYESNPDEKGRTKEADIVASKISNILSEKIKFELSSKQLILIHRYLFTDSLDRPGSFRTINIQKREWVLNGDTVTYCDYRELYDTLEYDLAIEKSFDYSKLDDEGKINHLARFVSNLWQCHPFIEGNTRTIAVFLIFYLRKLGYDVNNNIFAKNAWYFRNALVRANYVNYEKSIFEDRTFLIKLLRNLLFKEDNKLLSRELHIEKTILKLKKKEQYKPRERILIDLLKNNPTIKIEELSDYIQVSNRTIKNVIHLLKEKGIVRRVKGKRYGYWEVNE